MRKKTLDELRRLNPRNADQRPTIPGVLVLDNIRSGLNVGAVFRTADALGIEKIWLCGITVQPPHREILKTAIGATDTVDWSYAAKTEVAVKQLKNEDFKLIGIEQTTESIPLQDVEIQSDVSLALVFGNEVDGLSGEVLPLLDEAWEIPQFGVKHSFNISVSAGIVLWQVVQPYLDRLNRQE